MFWFYLVWLIMSHDIFTLGNACVLFYSLYVFCEVITYLIILDYSAQPRRDAKAIRVILAMPFYHTPSRSAARSAIR
jgi:hypothetical protein